MYATKPQTRSLSIEHEDYDGKPLDEFRSEVASIHSLTSHDPHTERHRTPYIRDSEEATDTMVPHSEALHVNAQHHLPPPDEPIPVTPDRTLGPHVRFRSRVRITAGIGRRQRLADGLSSCASSISGSPSSSISAPLRTHTTASSKGWVPLGSRVSFMVSQAAVPQPRGHTVRVNNSLKNGRRKHARTSFDSRTADERTRLMTSMSRPSYTANRSEEDLCQEDSKRARQRREQMVDQAFGIWPKRLLNRHWWWWQLEPLVCCFCVCGHLEEGE